MTHQPSPPEPDYHLHIEWEDGSTNDAQAFSAEEAIIILQNFEYHTKGTIVYAGITQKT
jgi:hypothetical protein